jgi:hypothetical protein
MHAHPSVRIDPRVLGLGVVGSNGEHHDRVGTVLCNGHGVTDVLRECQVIGHVVIRGQHGDGDVASQICDAQQPVEHPRCGITVVRLLDQPAGREFMLKEAIVPMTTSWSKRATRSARRAARDVVAGTGRGTPVARKTQVSRNEVSDGFCWGRETLDGRVLFSRAQWRERPTWKCRGCPGESRELSSQCRSRCSACASRPRHALLPRRLRLSKMSGNDTGGWPTPFHG